MPRHFRVAVGGGSGAATKRREPGASQMLSASIGSLVRKVALPLCGLFIAVGVTACGGSSSASASSSSVSSSASQAASNGTGSLPTNKAKGSPIVFGLENIELNPAISYPELKEGAEAAVDYVNNNLGGIHGRPIELDTCATEGTPESSSSCAEKLVQDKPLLIVGGTDTSTTASIPIFEQAKLPYLGGLSLAGPEISSPISVQFIGGIDGLWATMGVFAVKDLHVKRLGIIYNDVTAGKASAEIAKAAAINAGLPSSEVVEASYGATASDMTPVMSAIASKNPGAIIDIGSSNQCVSMPEAHESLGITAPLLVGGACGNRATLEQAGNSVVGEYMFDAFDPTNGNNPQVELFKQVLKKYAKPTIRVDEFTQTGFSSVIDIRNGLEKLQPSELNSADILKFFRSQHNAPNFMAHPYTCKPTIVPKAPALCNTSFVVLQIKVHGQTPVIHTFVNSAPFITKLN